ncbi:hypothetical protein ACH3XW_42970 [Acanthocheilonema viteae]
MASCCVPYVNYTGEECLHSQSEPSVLSIGHWDKSSCVLLSSSTRDRKTPVLSNTTISSKSLSRADSWPKPLTDEIIRGREMSVLTQKWCAVNDRETKGRFVKQEKKSSTGIKHYDSGNFQEQSGRLPKRSRSLGMESRYLNSSREKNWNRAKRIIGGVRKSINDLNACKFSASLDKLALPAMLHHETTVVALSSTDGTNQVERIPDGLKEPEFTTQGLALSLSAQSMNRLPGLIKLPPKKFSLIRARHILTKSLQKSISGSFSKYDGERSANHFNLEDAKCTVPMIDSIESAVKKSRARLLEAERRNSGFTDRASPTNPSSHSVWTTLPENVAVPSTWSNVGPSYVTESCLPSYDRKSPVKTVISTVDECCSAVNLLPIIPDRDSFKKTESLSPASVRMDLLPQMKRPSRDGSFIVGFNGSQKYTVSFLGFYYNCLHSNPLTAAKDTNAEKARTIPLCTAVSLSGSYCNLETKSSRNLPQKSSEVSRIVYVQIDPVATLGAIQTQQTMMRDRARVGNLIKNKRFSSQNNVESKDRSDEGWNRSGFFARRLWRKFPISKSYSDLRF